jgi:long-subunit fatty acid transport protein
MRKQLISAISGLLFLTSNIAAADEPKVEYGVEEIIKQYVPQINLPVPEQLKVKDFKDYDDGWSYQYSFKWRGHLFNKPKD